MSLIICPECGHENQDDARYCDMCGIELPLSFEDKLPSETEEHEVTQGGDEAGAIVSEEWESQQVQEVPEMMPQPEPEAEAEAEEPEPEAEAEAEEPEPQAEAEAEEPEPQAEAEEPEPQAEAEEPEPQAEAEEPEEPEPEPVVTATVLDFEEPELPLTAPPMAIEQVAFLLHNESGTRFEIKFSSEQPQIYIGKINEEMPVQVDLSQLPDADIVSRVHAAIHQEDGEFYLEDAGSLNGTSLNGEEVKPGARFRKHLHTGDIITLGRNRKVHLTFETQE
jgi:hypothetical protein